MEGDGFVYPAPPLPRNLPAPIAAATPRRPVDLLERRKYVGEEKTRLASQTDCYGYTWGKNNLQKSQFFVNLKQYLCGCIKLL